MAAAPRKLPTLAAARWTPLSSPACYHARGPRVHAAAMERLKAARSNPDVPPCLLLLLLLLLLLFEGAPIRFQLRANIVARRRLRCRCLQPAVRAPSGNRCWACSRRWRRTTLATAATPPLSAWSRRSRTARASTSSSTPWPATSCRLGLRGPLVLLLQNILYFTYFMIKKGI